ncbi:MAG: FxSxx-COOH system tetratricopeptide repeat protein [Blastocatellia bacterium]
MEDPKKDFFISYTSKDRKWAEWIAWQLEAAQFTSIIQAWDFGAGSDFIEEMDSASRKARRTIAVISPDYFKSQFTKSEWHVAFAEDATGEDRKLIPVRVRECDVEGLLRVRVYIDLVGKDKSEAKDELMRQVRAIVENIRLKPEAEPEFPLLDLLTGASRASGATGATGAQTEEPQFPGALPAVWNIPFRRNPHFTGRDGLIAEIDKALDAGKVAALTQPQAITGLGGVGKTQLAVEYAYRRAPDYDIVWWVKSEEPVTMATDFAALGSELTPPVEMATDLDHNVAAVKRRLERMTRREARWLVIFDNATDAASIGKLLPQNPNGHILITSRDRNWRGVAHPLAVTPLAREDSINFLTESIGRAAPSDREAAKQLAEELGDLPLALEQAGAYIDATSKPIADYLRLFRGKQRKMIARGQPSTGYEATIATTWEISFQSLRDKSPAAADLLNLFAFFAPDAIRREWIIAGTKHLPKTLATAAEPIRSIFSRIRGAKYLPKTLAAAVKDELAFDDIVAAFRRYSLVEVSAEQNAFTVHRLVQTVMRARMTDEECAKWAEAAVRMVNEAFPGGDFHEQPETWPLCGELLLHALSVAEQAEAFKVANEQTAVLLNQLGLYLQVLARYAEAKELLERALRIVEASLGSDHPYVANTVNNLALVLQDLGELAQARTLFERSLRIDEAAFGSDHPRVATDVNNLASVLQDLGELAQARALFERALAIFRKFFGDDHPNTKTVLRNLELLINKMSGE